MTSSARQRLSLITYIVSDWQGPSPLGKKALQKLVHMTTDGLSYKTGYKFTYYTYGAFSRDLMSDVDLLDARTAIQVDYNLFDRSYYIKRGEKADHFLSYFRDYYPDSNSLDEMLATFSSYSARNLEAVSTLLYVRKNEEKSDEESLKKRLIQLKPKYNYIEADRALNDLMHLDEIAHYPFIENVD